MARKRSNNPLVAPSTRQKKELSDWMLRLRQLITSLTKIKSQF